MAYAYPMCHRSEGCKEDCSWKLVFPDNDLRFEILTMRVDSIRLRIYVNDVYINGEEIARIVHQLLAPIDLDIHELDIGSDLDTDDDDDFEAGGDVGVSSCGVDDGSPVIITVLFIILLGIDQGLGSTSGIRAIALRNFELEDMELESTNSGPTAKLPILKLGEYEMWVIRIKQYFQIQDYALWEVIENVTAKEKTTKKNDVKARSLLLMALPNEHQLIFSQYPDAKSMFAAIKTRFGGNAATKKTQKTLLKQQYKNFSAKSVESLDSIFNRLQKIVSRLTILGVVIAQEDLNSIFLSSLPPEWNTHVVVWLNTPEIKTMSIDDLYNNFKIVEQKVKKSIGASSGGQNLAFMTGPSTSSTNDTNTASPQVSTASPNVNAASPQVSTASVSDNTMYAFMVENPNGSNVLHQELEQIHEDDFEEMDLKWQFSLLSVRAKKYYQRTGKKIFINANKIAGYDKSKVECYNYHKLGHFARECKAPRSKEGQFRNQDNTKKQGNNEDKSSKAMLAINGVGFDWSDMAEEQVQTNMALMAFSDSEVYTDKTCSKTCLKNYETLKKQCDDLLVKLNEYEFKATTYKRGLATLEDQIITYKKNEALFSEEIGVLKRELACKDYEINMLKSEFEKVKQEKNGIEFKIKKFDKASKDLDQLLGSQITDKSKKESEFKGYGPENSEQKSNVVCDKKSDNSEESLVEEQVSQDTSSFVESSPNVDKETVFPVNKKGKPQQDDKGFIDSGCSRHMTGNIAYLSDFKEFDGGYVAFGGGAYGGRITGKGTLKTDNLDFEDVYFVNELKFNLFSVSQMCDKKNYVLFTNTECLVLSPNFKLPDENQILLKIPRKDNMYSFDMKNIVPKESLTCLIAKATLDESMLWHRRLGHINFKNINKLVKDNLVRGLPIKRFENNQTCVACLIGKQHRASCKSKVLNPITKPLFMLHMDLFGPTFVSSLMHKKYCLVVTDDYSRFTWVFFLTTKDETSEILKNFIKEIENLVDKKVKIIRSDNGTEFKNKVLDDFAKKILGKFDGKSDEGTISNDSAVPNNENAEQDKFEDDSSTKDVNVTVQHVNTASPDVNTGSFKLNDVGPSVNTASSNEQDSPKDEPKVDLVNITNSYIVPTTPNTRIHKDHPIDNVISDVKSTVQTRRMTKPTSKQGFLSDVYEQKTHDTPDTCLYALFLSPD
ncbi:putative ribonuclease H-like domain-containing protein [Tanacetum coccineum]